MWPARWRRTLRSMNHAPTPAMPPILGLHHNAWRCSDSERTRAFYEDLLGLPLVRAFEIGRTKTGRDVRALHSFYALADGSCLAFFEVPGMPFTFKAQHDYDLHIALQVAADDLLTLKARAEAAGLAVRGVADHGFIHSIYLRDPDGYVVELTAPVAGADAGPDPAGARRALAQWQQHKPPAVDRPGREDG
jgi:catechol 2,3-dioxygenase-like lactoylglutathione lyase family enzyme